MQLFNRRINLEISINPVIGIAIGRSSYTLKNMKRVNYMLHILCFSIELGTRKLVSKKKSENQYIPNKKKTSKLANKLFGTILLFAICSVLSIYYSLNYESLFLLSPVLVASTFIIGFAYLLMPDHEKYVNHGN